MNKLLLSIFLLVVVQHGVSAAELWFDPITKNDFPRIEYFHTDEIWLSIMIGGSIVSVNGCAAAQVKIVPPSNLEDKWLSMIMAAFVSGGGIQIYGECNTTISSSPVIVASRFKMVLN